MSSSGLEREVDAFLAAVLDQDAARAAALLAQEPRLAAESVHAAAVAGREAELRAILAHDRDSARLRAGTPPAEPLVWLCHSPFHGQSPERDDALAQSARLLLDAGADPNARDGQYNIPALYGVTGPRSVPRIARMLLDAGASPDDGESVFHAAEHFHEDALELLREYGVDLNYKGDWGNTPLYFLLKYWDVAQLDPVERGMRWLLAHGADPNVRCGREQESALHVAVRRRQNAKIVRLLLDHGADVDATRADGRTAWVLAHRAGAAELASLLEEAGATPSIVSDADELVAACARGDEVTARKLAAHAAPSAFDAEFLQLLPEAARRGDLDVVRACLAAGVPVETTDDIGATALHHASLAGRAPVVAELLRHHPDVTRRDNEHHATPLGWATFAVDAMPEPDGDYEGCVAALLAAGAEPDPHHSPQHPAVAALLRRHRESPS